MRLRWIIGVGAIGLMIAWWYQNFVAVYVTVSSCMILYILRVISLQLEERLQLEKRNDPSEFDED